MSRDSHPPVNTDVVILTALELERDAALERLDSHQPALEAGEHIHRGKIGHYDVVVLCFQGMGNIRSAAATTRVIMTWSPPCILLAGIAGGTQRPLRERLAKGEQLLGDVLVAEQLVDYEFGKQTPEGVRPRYQVYRPAKPLLDAARRLSPQNWVMSIKTPRPDGTTGRVLPQVHFGVVASGQKVVTDLDLVEELRSDWAELVGIEMEGIGAALAVDEIGLRTAFLMAKGICDWADPEKGDDWQPYAAEASASFLAALLRSRPFEPKSQPREPTNSRQAVFPGKTKLEFCQRMVNDWRKLADYFEVPQHEIATFEKGNEARRIWEWLEQRGQLRELPEALGAIGRSDLAQVLKPDPH
ncbi:MAG: phosphorylase family protein [Planctomycetota bacterium]|jgi:nucleoside phosphorylase